MAPEAAGASVLELIIAGQPMRLLGDRALYWPARQRLMIADLHLGKGDVFRRAGISLPAGGTSDDLSRLERLVDDLHRIFSEGYLPSGAAVADGAGAATWSPAQD